MKGFTRSRFFRIGSVFVACLLLCISFVPLFFKPVEEAKADSVEEYFVFEGSNLIIPYSNNFFSGENYYSRPNTGGVYYMNMSCFLRTYDLVTVYGYNSASFQSFAVPNCPAPVHKATFNSSSELHSYYTNFYQNVDGEIIDGTTFNNDVLAVYAYNVDSNGLHHNIRSVDDVTSTTVFRYTQFFSPLPTLDQLVGRIIGPRVDTYIQYGFSSDVVSIRLYGEYVYPSTYGTNNIQYKNHIVYTDSKAYTCDVVVTGYLYLSGNTTLSGDELKRSLIFDDRTYYLKVNGNYEEGKLAGIAEGERNKLEYANARVEAAKIEWNKNLDFLLEEAEEKGFSDGEAVGFQKGVGSNFGLEPFLTSAYAALNVKIFGVFSIGELFVLTVGVYLVFFVLRIFAGG